MTKVFILTECGGSFVNLDKITNSDLLSIRASVEAHWQEAQDHHVRLRVINSVYKDSV